MITPDEAAQMMREIADNAHGDTESAHGDGDDLLCSILSEMGYDDAVEIFERMPKWYA